MNRAFIILGMHRSGTSALTGSLEQLGIYLGDVNSYSPDNLKGNRESRSVMTLNEDILNRSGGSWDAPVTNLEWSPLHKLTRDLIVRSFDAKAIWGFKDPRTLLLLEGWLQAIPSAELICIFRHPFLVAQSLYNRNAIDYERGLELWITYNRILKYHLEHNKNSFVLEFSTCSEEFNTQLESMTTHLGLSSIECDFYEPTLKQSEIPELSNVRNAKEAMSVYTNLQKHLPVKQNS